MSNTIDDIIKCLDSWIEKNHVSRLTANEAAEILAKAGILKDSKDRPGQRLRMKLRNGEIPHAYQEGGRWYIPKSSDL